MNDYLFNWDLNDFDPEITKLTALETERQKRKLIMIPSESFAPEMVRQSLSTVFQNVYAEGYPDPSGRLMTEDQILDYELRLGEYRRNSDPRYYKGVEYVDVLESLARRRCAELFATEKFSADELYVNVQPLSGAPANNAAYHIIKPGDTVLTMDLLHGGHLTHGSPVNRTGMLYNIVHYTVDPETQMLNYDEIERIALECNPKMIIAGFTSYPYIPDWQRYRQICDKVGAYLMADIAHIAGLVSAKVVPSPIGIADVVTFTSHKTLSGPRGAVIITTNPVISKTVDKAVFPGEQGGPHTQVFAALATNFKLAMTDEFRTYQQQILNNTQALIHQLKERGVTIPYNGSDSHMVLIDCKPFKGADGATLSGDIAARILDNAGIVCNRNTIPGDKSALRASGIRLGLPCVTQLGMKEPEMVKIANLIADLLYATHPYYIPGAKSMLLRSKIDFSVFERCKAEVRDLCGRFVTLDRSAFYGYPHFYYIDDEFESVDGKSCLLIHGDKAQEFVNYAFMNDSESLEGVETQHATLWTDQGTISGSMMNTEKGFLFCCESSQIGLAAAWLRGLSEGFIRFDDDLRMRLPGPVIISAHSPESGQESINSEFVKPYAVGMGETDSTCLPDFDFAKFDDHKAANEPRRTPLYDIHVQSGAKMAPFAGWDMPLWYTSVKDEHEAVRSAAGLFDVTHMGVYRASGPDAMAFLDSVCANDISALSVGETCYTHFLDPDANVIDDLIVYAIAEQTYLVVVNAANDEKDWAWLEAVRDNHVLVDRNRPCARAFGRHVILEDLRNPRMGDQQRVDIALQGKASKDILLSLESSPADKKVIEQLPRSAVGHVTLNGIDIILARTGYTGEKISFELFVHPDRAVELWRLLIEKGEPFGLKPCGLASRDSLRIEAGLPLYGHELAGSNNIKVNEAGFAHFVKTYKPWFIGRAAYLKDEKELTNRIIRFRFNEKAVRMAHGGDPILDVKGKMIGTVTSCSVDREGWITGLGLVEKSATAEGTNIFIYQNSGKVKPVSPDSIKPGEKVTLPGAATVLSRYMKA
ncbi:MAG: glycine cleavage system aminomethyltransferase GcvT [Chloroflexi bacterium]|nr:glycine cleavage system aminomethyltransferase GcvT [Chloroflexota bacterium]